MVKQQEDKQHKQSQHDDSVKADSTPHTHTKEPQASEFDELKERYLRLQAEFANYQKRTEEERKALYDMGASDALTSIVEVLDDYEMALKNDNNLESFKKGMEMIYAKFISAGERFGLERIATVGEQFNPTVHEALLAEQSDEPEQTILEELQSGYKLKDKVLRTAKVKVAK